jgi:uncharacterized membrane protein YfcA
MDVLWLAPLGILAGVLSTVAGLGGGVFLVLSVSLLRDPQTALAITTPGLLLSNLHRFAVYRKHLNRKIGGIFMLGAFPGALIASLFTVAMPALAVRIILVMVTALALVRAFGWWRWTPGPRSLAPAGLATGAIGASSGGGIMIAPILLAAGVQGDAVVATASLSAVVIHVGRVLGYGLTGFITTSTLYESAVLAIALVIGNLVGQRMRGKLSERASERLTYGTMVVCTLIAIAGLSR